MAGRSLLKWTRRVALGAGILVVVMQAVPYGRSHSNPPVTGEPPWESSDFRTRFMQVCGDCHSNESRWPWYSNIAPASWLVQRDVDEGREHFNVSTWDQGQRHAGDAVEEFSEGEMPPWFYTPLHSDARLSRDERGPFLNGLRSTFGGNAKYGREGDED